MSETTPSTATARRASIGPLAGWLLAIAVLLVLPYIFTSGFARSLLSQMGIAVVFALSYNMLLGQSGMLSFGHAVYSGMGGFTAIHFMKSSGAALLVPTAVLPLVGGLGGAAFGAVFGYFATRRSGTAFAMITLGLGELMAASALMFPFFGGDAGIIGDRTAAPPLLGVSFGPQINVYFLIAAWTLLCALGMRLFQRTPLGHMAAAVRENIERVAFVGYDPGRVRYLIFIISAFFAGIGGGLYAINYEIVTFVTLGAEASGLVVMMAFIGGTRHFIGPIIGAVLITYLQVTLTAYTDAWLLYLGLVFILVVMFAPEGLAGIVVPQLAMLRAGQGRSLLQVWARFLPPALLLFVGAVGIIECGYRLSVSPDKGPLVGVLGVTVDAHSALTWIVFGALMLAGIVLFARWGRPMSEAWQSASAQATLRLAGATR